MFARFTKLSFDIARIASKSLFAGFTVDLATSPLERDRKEYQTLMTEVQKARCRMWCELVGKLAYFQQLPHKLLQLGHPDPLQVCIGAKRCLELWDMNGLGNRHRQSRRFLDADYQSSTDDPPLRKLVERLARGESMFGCSDFQPLIKWVARFSCIRLAERSVEGIHAVVTRTYKRAPRAALPYVSIELRFKCFWDMIVNHPPALWWCNYASALFSTFCRAVVPSN